MLVHAATYRGINPVAALHRRRLGRILQLLGRLDLAQKGRWADFGCSDGFILSLIRGGPLKALHWRCDGFDYSEALLDLARERNLPDTDFHLLDLNVPSTGWEGNFDVVTCFETLEHTGNYKNALRNLVEACAPGGWIIISVPNEVGVPGLTKFLGRRLIRRNPYGDFFQDRSEVRYLWHLLANRDLESFRRPPASGWGPHLGFDSRKLFQVIEEEYLRPGSCTLLISRASPFAFTHFFALRRIP